MTEDATILSLPLGRVQGGRRAASNPAVRPPSVALQLPAGRPNRTTTAQREAKRARPPRPPVAVVASLLSACASQLTARPAALHHLLGQDTSPSVDLRHSKWQYNGGVES